MVDRTEAEVARVPVFVIKENKQQLASTHNAVLGYDKCSGTHRGLERRKIELVGLATFQCDRVVSARRS